MKKKAQTLITAHAGPDGTLDNSLESIDYILETKADALELDVRYDSEKDRLVLAHDPELASDVVTAEMAFTKIAKHPSMRINCDLKEGGLEHKVYALAKDYGIEDRLIYTGAADPANCQALPIKLFLNVEYFADGDEDKKAFLALPAKERDEQIRELYPKLREMPVFALNTPYIIFSEDFFTKDEDKSFPLSLWTVDEEQLLRRFIERKVYAITTRTLQKALDIRDTLET